MPYGLKRHQQAESLHFTIHRSLIATSGSAAPTLRYDHLHALRPETFPASRVAPVLTFSCFRRLPWLASPAAKDLFETALEQTRARHQASIYAYVLISEHVHLLINEPALILPTHFKGAQFLKALKQTTSRHLRGSRENLWQVRYFDAMSGSQPQRPDRPSSPRPAA